MSMIIRLFLYCIANYHVFKHFIFYNQIFDRLDLKEVDPTYIGVNFLLQF